MQHRSSSRKVNLAAAAFLATIIPFGAQLRAQAPADLGPIPFARLLIDTSIGNETQLGFKPPDLGVGFAMEKPMGRHVELQTSADYSLDKKYITNDGESLVWSVKGIWFPRWHFGFSAEIRQSHLWTSQFDKSGWIPAAGAMIRDNLLGLPGRFSVDYVIPTGCVWATLCTLPADGIQSNRTQGSELSQEFRAISLSKYAFRIGGELAFYHFCDQTNPLVPAPRTCHLADTAALTVRLEFSGKTGSKDRWY